MQIEGKFAAVYTTMKAYLGWIEEVDEEWLVMREFTAQQMKTLVPITSVQSIEIDDEHTLHRS